MSFIRILVIPVTLMAGLLAACTNTPAASNPYASGATGQAVVPGNSSSVAADAPATRNTQTGQTSTGTGGGTGK
jgi:uncharacterized SAM-binding protein YcdF (DUF218 family)